MIMCYKTCDRETVNVTILC